MNRSEIVCRGLLNRPRGVVGAWMLVATLSFVQAASPVSSTPTRAERVSRYDKDGNGRLDASERETMRLELKEERLKSSGGGLQVPPDFLADYDANKDGDMNESEWAAASVAEKNILTKQFDADQNGSLSAAEMETMLQFIRTKPVRFARDYFAYMIRYDKNGDNNFDGDEYQTAQAAEGAVVVRTYDANHNAKLDPDELQALRADLKRGAIPGFYARFAAAVAGGGNRPSRPTETQTENFDLDGDGLASAEELRRARAARSSGTKQ